MASKIQPLLCCLTMFLTFRAISCVLIAKSERQALSEVMIDFDTYHPTSWTFSNPCSKWTGLTCDSNGYVTEINIEYQALSPVRYFSPSLTKLTRLQKLRIYHCYMRGTIPSSIEKLKNLKELNLEGNKLDEALPGSIGNLPNLEYLSLAGNAFTASIPTSIGNLSKLKYLYLSSNQLSGKIPSSIGRLSNLIDLKLSRNDLYGYIPPELYNLKRLKYLNLAYNKLGGLISDKISRMYFLNYAYFDENYFTSIGAINPYAITDFGFFGNCVSTYAEGWKGIKGFQKSTSTCKAFCNSDSVKGACDGHGICYLAGKTPTCSCDKGYKLGKNKFACVRA